MGGVVPGVASGINASSSARAALGAAGAGMARGLFGQTAGDRQISGRDLTTHKPSGPYPAGMKPTFATTVSPARGAGLPKNAWFGTQDTYLRETRQKLDALRADLADAEARTRLMVRMGWFELDRARRERSLYKDRLLELSQTSLDVSTRAYESGGVSFADVISSYTGWLDVNLASQRRNSDVGVAWAELERRVGTALP